MFFSTVRNRKRGDMGLPLKAYKSFLVHRGDEAALLTGYEVGDGQKATRKGDEPGAGTELLV